MRSLLRQVPLSLSFMALAFMAGESANRSYHQPAVNLCAPIEQPNRDGSITLTIHGNCWIQETPKVPDGPTILRLEKTCPVGSIVGRDKKGWFCTWFESGLNEVGNP